MEGRAVLLHFGIMKRTFLLIVSSTHGRLCIVTRNKGDKQRKISKSIQNMVAQYLE